MAEYTCKAFGHNTDNPNSPNCCMGGYTDPLHGYTAVSLIAYPVCLHDQLNDNMDQCWINDYNNSGNIDPEDVYHHFGNVMTCNYNQYCYEMAVDCFSNCSGPFGQPCAQGCMSLTRQCCEKTGSFADDPQAGSICGMWNQENPEWEDYYFDCDCTSQSTMRDYGTAPPKMSKKIPNQLLSGPGNGKDKVARHQASMNRGTVNTRGNSPNKLKKQLIKRKCGKNEIRLPNGVCSKSSITSIKPTEDGDHIMAHSTCCGMSNCDDFYVRVMCEEAEFTCTNPEGCGPESTPNYWSIDNAVMFGLSLFNWNEWTEDLLYPTTATYYSYGETYSALLYNFENVSGQAYGCSGGCSLQGGSMHAACLGAGVPIVTDESACGTVTRCNCICTDDCNNAGDHSPIGPGVPPKGWV